MATTSDIDNLTIADLLDQLGGVPAARVRLHPPPGTATEADVLELEARRNVLCELVDGVLVEKAMGFREALLALAMAGFLRNFVVPRNLGLVVGADGMLRLFPGLVRIPDVTYICWARFPDGRVPSAPIPAVAPDLAVEVLSLSNTAGEMARKRREYLSAGTKLVWEIDPELRTVAVYSEPEEPVVLTATETLDGGDVLPGFLLPLADLFAELDRQAHP